MPVNLTLKKGEFNNLHDDSKGKELNSGKKFYVRQTDVSTTWVPAKAPSSELPNSNVVVTLHELDFHKENGNIREGKISLSSDTQQLYSFYSELVDRTE